MSVSDLLSLRTSDINECISELIVTEGSRATPMQRGYSVRLVQRAAEVGNLKVPNWG